MLPFVLACLLFSAIGIAVYGGRRLWLRGRTLDRLGESLDMASTSEPVLRGSLRHGPLRRKWFWLPWGIGMVVGLVLAIFVGIQTSFAVAFGVIVAIVGSQIEGFFAQNRVEKIEAQLADAVDIMVGALGAGAGVTQAIEAALVETRAPLRGELVETLGRIRYGDDPQVVLRNFSLRVPLETFLLFTTSLAVHWEVGGSLAPILANVGRTIRDRIEISRRIRSNITQSQFSTYAILGLTYFIAAIVWRNAPDQMIRLVRSSAGSAAIAATMILQAVGILWMSLISKPKF